MPSTSLRVRVMALSMAGALLPLTAAPVALAAADAPAASAADPDTAGATTGTLAPIEVTSSRLRDARIGLSPSVGTTVYAIDSKTVAGLSEGAASSFDEVLLHLPGVSKDSKASGALHVRDDHGNVQYRVNGVQLPESLSGFGTAIDTRFIDRVEFLTGALPAQYGLHTAGVIEIQTREGKVVPGGEVDLQGGSRGTWQPSAQLFGSAGALTWYLSASGLSSREGVENPLPTPSALHDQTWQARSFGNLSWFIDEDTRAALMFGSYRGRFQIPVRPGQPANWTLAGVSDVATGSSTLPSERLDQRQRESNRFTALSLEQTLGQFGYQLSIFHQTSSLHYLPDPTGDLIFTGVSGDLLRASSSNGAQFDSSWKVSPAHVVRLGAAYTAQLSSTSNQLTVFALDPAGQQLAVPPLQIGEGESRLGTQGSVYLQDEWHLDEALTVNYGLRFDRVTAYIDEQQLSPRINLAWKLPDNTLLHAGFSRYFTPPPQELAAQRSITLYAGTSNAPASPQTDNVRAERTSYYDVGVARALTGELTIALDAYLKDIDQLIDEGQFGQALILSPYNYAHGRARGVELSLTYGGKQWSAYGNLAWQRAQARNIDSGQALFAPTELAYIAQHAIYLDHDQTWTGSLGSAIHLGAVQLSADAVFGTGLRRTAADGTPNGDHLPGYGVLNLALSRTWKLASQGEIEARLSALNVLDRVYLLRDGSGVGVGAPQYGLRQSWYASLSWRV